MSSDRARFREWEDANYETLQDLYWIFLESGRQAFGHGFFHSGDFNYFVRFVYVHTHMGYHTSD